MTCQDDIDQIVHPQPAYALARTAFFGEEFVTGESRTATRKPTEMIFGFQVFSGPLKSKWRWGWKLLAINHLGFQARGV